MIAEVFGIRCLSGQDACQAFSSDPDELFYLTMSRLPYIKIGSIYYYPVSLCIRWFRGDNTAAEAADLRERVAYANHHPAAYRGWYKRGRFTR